MATTTASITLSSADLLTDNLSLSATMNLYQGGTTATGLEEFRMERMELPTGTQFDLIEATTAATEDANYMYIINKNTDVTDYVIISINDEVIGRLYAGDWLFMPWDSDLTAADTDSSIELQAYTHECTIEYAMFHVGETLLTASDS